jgi:hypothetical protein
MSGGDQLLDLGKEVIFQSETAGVGQNLPNVARQRRQVDIQKPPHATRRLVQLSVPLGFTNPDVGFSLCCSQQGVIRLRVCSS